MQYEVSSSYGKMKFNSIVAAENYAIRQSELLTGKFFVYNMAWNKDVPFSMFRDGREQR